jgi:hypothetical protein
MDEVDGWMDGSIFVHEPSVFKTKGLTPLRQLGFSDVDYSSGIFSKQMFTSHHFVNGHVPHYQQFSTTQGS